MIGSIPLCVGVSALASVDEPDVNAVTSNEIDSGSPVAKLVWSLVSVLVKLVLAAGFVCVTDWTNVPSCIGGPDDALGTLVNTVSVPVSPAPLEERQRMDRRS